jgi:hypothetical protein
MSKPDRATAAGANKDLVLRADIEDLEATVRVRSWGFFLAVALLLGLVIWFFFALGTWQGISGAVFSALALGRQWQARHSAAVRRDELVRRLERGELLRSTDEVGHLPGSLPVASPQSGQDSTTA